MKIGDLVTYREPGLDIVVAYGIITEVKQDKIRVFWDTGALVWNEAKYPIGVLSASR